MSSNGLDFSTPTIGGSGLPQASSNASSNNPLQGSALPSITTTQQQSTSTPDFYTNYLNTLAGQGTTALNGESYQGATANQTNAFNQVGQNVGNYQNGLNTATSTLNNGMSLNPTSTAQMYTGMGLNNPTGADAASPYLSASANSGGVNASTPYINSAVNSQTGAQAANPTLSGATGMLGANAANPYLNAATQTSTNNINAYMNPYTNDVVNSIGALNQQNIQQNLSPGITAGAVGSGQFGSARGAQALALGIANADTGALAQQNQALQAGYTQALTAAQQQQANELQAGTTLGNLTNQSAATNANIGATQGSLQNQAVQNLLTAGSTQGTLAQAQASNLGALGNTAGGLQNQANTNYLTAGQNIGALGNQQVANTTQGALAAGTLAGQQQQYGLNDVNAQATLGAQQQAINQAQNMFPTTALQQYGTLMQGQTIPTSTSQSATGPIPGAYSASPLAQLAALGSGAAGLSSLGSSALSALGLGSLLGGSSSTGSSSSSLGLSGVDPSLYGSNAGVTTDNTLQNSSVAGQTQFGGNPSATQVATPAQSALTSLTGSGNPTPAGVDLNQQQLSNTASYFQQNAGNPQAVMQAMTQYGISGADLAAATGTTTDQVASYLANAGAPAGFGGVTAQVY